MDHSTDPASASKSFRAVLTPNRSLSKAGFCILLAAMSLASFLAGIYFSAIGAWPVLGFFGLDVALLYAAFRFNYRAGRSFEVVELDTEWLSVVKVAPSRKASSAKKAFQGPWAALGRLMKIASLQALLSAM